MCNETQALLISYNPAAGSFFRLSQADGMEPVWQTLAENGDGAAALREHAAALGNEPQARFLQLAIGGRHCQCSLFVPGSGAPVTIALTLLPPASAAPEHCDHLTGLHQREDFCAAVEQRLLADSEGAAREE